MPATARSRVLSDPAEPYSVLRPARHLHAVGGTTAAPERPGQAPRPVDASAIPLRASEPTRARRLPLPRTTHEAPSRITVDQLPVPPPDAALQRLALFAFEILEGMRSITQIAAWITPAVAASLRARRALRIERECLTRDRRRRVAVPGRAHVCCPRPGVVEASVVLHVEPRTTVVALRVEHREGRWRATELTVL